VRGLRDLYASIAPKMPCEGRKMKLAFHQFWDDQGGDALGQEYDMVTSYAIDEHVSLLWNVAYFDGGKKRSPVASVTRSILQATVDF